MHDEPTPRNLPERTGKHYCVSCLREISSAEYQRNDMLCDECARVDEEREKRDEEG